MVPGRVMAPAERAGVLGLMAGALMSRAAELGDIWLNEMGVVSSVSSYNAPTAAGIFGYYAALGGTFEFQEPHVPSFGGGAGLLVHEPVGVVAAVIPWNAPLTLLAYKLAPALLAGCTVVLKTAPEAPLDAYVFAENMRAARLAAGRGQYHHGGPRRLGVAGSPSGY